MAGQTNQDLARAVVDRYKSRATEYATGIANRLGSPLSGQALSTDQVAKLWNYSPYPDPAAAYQQRIAQGMTPNQALNGVEPPVGNSKVHPDGVHPYRTMLYSNGASTLPQQLQKAEQLSRLAAGHQQADTPERTESWASPSALPTQGNP